MSRILVIEDDPRIQKALHRQFSAEGYEVHVESDGVKGIASCKNLKPVAVVLDLMLPGMSGRDICKELKAWSANLPVIVLSAVSEVADKVLLLELGADDYMTKPFSPRELLARVQAAIRRTHKTSGSNLTQFGNISADFTKMEVFRDGLPVALTAHEIKLLKYFVDHAERVITREELLNDVWGYSSYPTTRTVDNQIMKLRQKLEPDPAKPLFFKTMHGIGYKFVNGS
jgi:DNA-binding response OmpR family regulator